MDIQKEIEELRSKMTPMGTAKFIAGTLISLGTAAAVMAVMKGGLAGSKGVTKLIMKLGIFVLACKCGDVAESYFDETFDKCQEAFKEGQDIATKEAE